MSLHTQFNYNDKNPVHLYYDINIINNDKTGVSASPPIVFNDTRSDVILQNPSEYFLSVNRFTLDTPSLPIFCPLINTTNLFGNVNRTIYELAVSFGGLATKQSIIIPINFIPQDKTVPVPTLASVQANNIQDYYYLYSYQYFIDLINTSIQEYFRADTYFNVANSTPFFTFNKETNKASIYFPQDTQNTTWGGNYATTGTGDVKPLFLYMNAPLYNLFSSFNAEYVENITLVGGTQNSGGWYRLIINPPNVNATLATTSIPANNNILGVNSVPISTFPNRNLTYYPADNGAVPPVPQVVTFTILSQDFATTPLWTPVQAIVFTTSLMPITNELTGVPNVFNDNFDGITTGGNNRNLTPILTDIEIPLTRGDEYKPTIYYAPVSEYRLADLQSNTPVNSIQISVFWKDSYGLYHPLLLDAGCSATLKLMFRKKIFNLPKI